MFDLTHSRFAWLLALAPAAFSVLVFGCGENDRTPQAGAPDGAATSAQTEELPTVEMPSLWAWGDAERLDTLIGSADVVFTGTVVAHKGQRAALERTGESGTPAPRWANRPVSQFELRVESVLSGALTAETTVTMEQLGGIDTRPDGTRVRIMLERDPPLEVGQRYVIFGTFQDDGSIVSSPFGRLKVRPDGSLAAEPGWENVGALAQLSRTKLADAEQQIRVTAGD